MRWNSGVRSRYSEEGIRLRLSKTKLLEGGDFQFFLSPDFWILNSEV